MSYHQEESFVDHSEYYIIPSSSSSTLLNHEHLKQLGEEFLKESISSSARLLYITVVGSTLYNLKEESPSSGSDFDLLMIYMLNGEQFLSMPSFSIDEPELTYVDVNAIGSSKTRVLNLSEKGLTSVTKDGHDISCFGMCTH